MLEIRLTASHILSHVILNTCEVSTSFISKDEDTGAYINIKLAQCLIFISGKIKTKIREPNSRVHDLDHALCLSHDSNRT